MALRISHVFISRPRQEAAELAAMVVPLGLDSVIQPAFDYLALDGHTEDPGAFELSEQAGASDLFVFTSPRAVTHGLPQLSRDVLLRSRVAAIGPSTAAALAAAGISVGVTPAAGYTSEALLEVLGAGSVVPAAIAQAQGRAFIVAAPGGRQALAQGLGRAGWQTVYLMVYRSVPAELDRDALAELADASNILSIWTSGNAMKSLAQRLPPAAWYRLCRGEWLVISDRLERLARAYGPAGIHLAAGPDNGSILTAIRALM
jgi:uroporphyrinogen-III synthase